MSPTNGIMQGNSFAGNQHQYGGHPTHIRNNNGNATGGIPQGVSNQPFEDYHLSNELAQQQYIEPSSYNVSSGSHHGAHLNGQLSNLHQQNHSQFQSRAGGDGSGLNNTSKRNLSKKSVNNNNNVNSLRFRRQLIANKAQAAGSSIGNKNQINALQSAYNNNLGSSGYVGNSNQHAGGSLQRDNNRQ